MGTDTTQGPAERLAEAGITTTPATMTRVVHHVRKMQPQLVEERGVMLRFTGVPVDSETHGTQTAHVWLTQDGLRALADALNNVRTSPLTLATYQDPNTMNLFGPQNIALTVDSVRWESPVFGDYCLPLSPGLLEDLRTCLEAEVTMVALVSRTTP